MIKRVLLKLLLEPLIHFLILGAGLFVVYSAVNGSVISTADRIIVDETQSLRLAEQFQRTWMRPPTRQELQNLAEEYVKEEILYREALSLGLDRDDLIIRRRLRQKIEFLNADLVEPLTPTQAQLQAYLDANRERFRIPDRFSFEQIYLNPYKPSADAGQRAAELLERLNVDPSLAADPTSLGDASLLPVQFDAATVSEVSRTFGHAFAKDIEEMHVDRWSGPYESSYGLHLVRMTGRQAGGQPAVADIRSALEREWTAERRREADERFYRSIRARYNVEIRLPADSAGKILAVR